MFSPSTVNVLPFDPRHGADEASRYAGKYAAKPEPFFFMESSERNRVKEFLQARCLSAPMAVNRLLGFRVVRSTIPTPFIHTQFAPAAEKRMRRLNYDIVICLIFSFKIQIEIFPLPLRIF